MPQLIEPDETPNVHVTFQEAVRWCREHPGWTWRQTEEDEEEAQGE